MSDSRSPKDKNGEPTSTENNQQPEKEIILSKIKPLLDSSNLPREKKDKIVEAVFGVVSYSYRGAYPPPEMLKAYNSALPDGAERIMVLVEQQSKHRIQLESQVIARQSKESSLGQKFGFIIALLGLGVSTLLSLTGHETVAGIIGGSTILGLTTAFIKGREQQKSNLSKKSK